MPPINGCFSLQNGHSETKCAVEVRHLTVNEFSPSTYCIVFITYLYICVEASPILLLFP